MVNENLPVFCVNCVKCIWNATERPRLHTQELLWHGSVWQSILEFIEDPVIPVLFLLPTDVSQTWTFSLSFSSMSLDTLPYWICFLDSGVWGHPIKFCIISKSTSASTVHLHYTPQLISSARSFLKFTYKYCIKNESWEWIMEAFLWQLLSSMQTHLLAHSSRLLIGATFLYHANVVC